MSRQAGRGGRCRVADIVGVVAGNSSHHREVSTEAVVDGALPPGADVERALGGRRRGHLVVALDVQVAEWPHEDRDHTNDDADDRDDDHGTTGCRLLHCRALPVDGRVVEDRCDLSSVDGSKL